MKFSENLRRLRKERGYSQEELAEKLSVTRQAISKWENATAMPDLKKITETAQLFGVSMDELLGIEPDIKTATTETEYNNQVYNLKLLQQEKKTKTLVIVIIVLAVLLLSSLFSIGVLYSKQTTMFSMLQTNINALSTQISNLKANNDDYDYTDEEVDVTAKVIGYHKDNPKIIDIELKYHPTSYPKDAKVYFVINDYDGKTKRVDAVNDNNYFKAVTDFDITLGLDKFQVCVDDSNTVTPMSFDVCFDYEYCSIESFSIAHSYESNVFTGGKYSYFIPETYIPIRYIFDSPIKSAKIIVGFENNSPREIDLVAQPVEDDEYLGYAYDLNISESNEEFISDTIPNSSEIIVELEDGTIISSETYVDSSETYVDGISMISLPKCKIAFPNNKTVELY